MKITCLFCIVVAFREIKKYQKNVKLLISKTLFTRLMKKVAQNFKFDLRFKSDAIETLQKILKYINVNFFERK